MQGAANAYSIERDPRFSKWFESVLIMDELESFELSCQVEPLHPTPTAPSSSGSKESRFRRRITPLGGHHRKNDSIASTVSGSSSSSVPLGGEAAAAGEPRDDDDLKTVASSSLNDSVRSRISSASSGCSTPSLDTSLSSPAAKAVPPTPDRTGGVSDKPDPGQDPFRTPEFYIIRVSLESSTEATEGSVHGRFSRHFFSYTDEKFTRNY